MIADKNRAYDGWDSLTGGMDSGRRSNLIGEDQVAVAENVVFRGGSPVTRPGIPKRELVFQNNVTYAANGSLGAGTGSQAAFEQGLFQGAEYYNPSLGSESLMVSIGGRLFKIVPRGTTAEVIELALPQRNRSNIPIAYMVQADRFHITQDGESKAIIYDGVVARRAGDEEIPVGTMMAYGMGRIVLVGIDRSTIIFGDLFGSHTGDPGESVLKFTETNFLAEGGSASVPFTMGLIKGVIFYPQQDTSTGQGELLVFAQRGMASFFLSLPREQWKESNFQRMGLINIGGRGHNAFTPINGDIWFRSGDGWRTYRQARSAPAGWFQLPLSTEVGIYLNSENQDLLEFASSVNFDNRLIATCTPIPNQGKPYHNGFVVLDFDVLSSFGKASRPSWDGHWSGLKTLQLVEGIFAGNRRAFAFGLDSGGLNALYEVTLNEVEDSTGPITSWIDSRSFSFQSPYNEDGLYDADFWPERVRASTQFSFFYKPDQYPDWIPWRPHDDGSCPLEAIEPISDCGKINCGVCPTFRQGFYPRRSLTKPPYFCDDTTKRDTKRGYEFSVRMRWNGNAAVRRFRIHSQPKVEPSTSKP